MAKLLNNGRKLGWLLAFVVCSTHVNAEVEFAYTVGAELNSAYLFRGMYEGGLSFQPCVEIGYEGQLTSLTVGAFGNIGASDWKFQKGLEATEYYCPNTYFVPEIDLYANFRVVGIDLGTTFLEYFNDWQWEVTAGYYFEDLLDFPLYVLWGTIIKSSYDKDIPQDYASYLELGYTQPLPLDFSLGGVIGMSPWGNYTYGNEKFAVINLSLRLEKSWEVGPCTLSAFAQGTINPDALARDRSTAYVLGAGDDKREVQSVNGTIGFGFWF